jgi:diguanylate cyclase (GGDEF)-like protein
METARAPDRAETQAPSQIRGAVVVAGLVLLLLIHAALLASMGDQSAHGSFAFLIGTPLLAAAVCLHRALRDGREGWLPLAGGMVCWAGGMAATMVSMLMLDGTGVGSLSMLLYVLYGVPLIFALASPVDEAWPVRLVDAVLAAALGYFFFRYVFAMATPVEADEIGSAALRLLFDIENIYILLFAIVRLMACAEERQRDFLRVLAAYAGLYLLTAAYINHVESDSDFGLWPDLLIDLPFLLLAGLAMIWRGGAMKAVPRSLARLVRAGSPLMLPATVLTVSGLLLSHDARLAVAGCVVATLGYGLRSVLVQLRSYDEQDRLAELSHVDALTGVANRRLFDEVLRREAARARRQGGALALMMIDIDHFKQLNDQYGHPVGDARLREVAAVLAAHARRGTDLVARYGGEEFAVIMPGLHPREAAAMAEQMRAAVEGRRLPAPGGVVTVSIGLAHLLARDADPAALVDSADRALYDAKRGGRNRVGVERLALVSAG